MKFALTLLFTTALADYLDQLDEQAIDRQFASMVADPSYQELNMQVLQEFGRRLGVSSTYLANGTDAPDHIDALDDADLAVRLGDHERAGELYDAVTHESLPAPMRLARAFAGLGEIAYQRGEFEEAAQLLESALAEPTLGHDRGAVVADFAYAPTGKKQTLRSRGKAAAAAPASTDSSSEGQVP